MLVLLRAAAIILAAFRTVVLKVHENRLSNWLLLLQANTHFNEDTLAQLQKPLACGLSSNGCTLEYKNILL